MFEELSAQINDAALRMAKYERLQRHWQSLRDERTAAQQIADDLQAQMEREDRDVAQLEHLSLTGLFLTVLGRKEERLDKERQEALAAHLRYQEAAARAQSLQAEMNRLELELGTVRYAQEEHAKLLQQKAERLRELPGADELRRLDEQESALAWQVQQLDEALAAGRSAAESLAAADDHLGSAKNWGTYDMLGGGFLATAAKHSHIDDARACAHDAQRALATFKRELQDCSLFLDAESVSVEGFAKFADYFFDGLIADWVVQNQIKESQTHVLGVHQQVQSLLRLLAERQSSATAQLSTVRAARTRLVASWQ